MIIEDKDFAVAVTLSLLVRAQEADDLEAGLVDLSEGTLAPVRFDQFYRAWPEEE